MKVREAGPRDHAAIAALHPQLEIPGPVPTPDEWRRDAMPGTVVADAGGQIVGYALYRVYGENGHVVQVVVAAAQRRRGIGAALMRDVARRMRAAGCHRWHLNVKEDNQGAQHLYRILGFELLFAAQSLRVPDQAVAALPPVRGVRVAPTADQHVAPLETRFRLSPGALLRRIGVTLRADFAGQPVAVARLSPAMALAAPFRIRDHRAARAFFLGMRRWIDEPALRVVVEADARLTELLCGAGAEEEMRLLHLEGKLR